ncbi:MAG: apolipoprotein N-acyltransferase [bacterium]
MKLFKNYKQDKNNLPSNKIWFGVLSGMLLGFSYPPIPFPFFIFFAFIPYLFELEKRESLVSINRLTYTFAFVLNVITLYWVGSWTKQADFFLMLSGGILLFFNPILYLIPSTIYYLTKKFFNKKTALLLFPVFWITFEYAYTITEFRFPWLTLGNSLAYFTSFIQMADLIGVYGLSLFVLYINIVIYFVVKKYLAEKIVDKKSIIIASLLIMVPLIYGFYKIASYKESAKTINVGLIQPNLNPWAKWEAGSTQTQLNIYLDLSKKAINKGAEYLFFPETALPVYLLDGQHYRFVNQFYRFCDSNKVSIITGMPHILYYYGKNNFPKNSKPTLNPNVNYTSFNSVMLFKPFDRRIDFYGKIMLVPFGEKVPLVEYIPFLGDLIKWEVGISSWNVGNDTVVFKVPNIDPAIKDTIKIASIICIESIYPDFTAAFVKKGAQLISVVTNDSWYGNSSGPYQHQAIGAIRAVENRRYVIRAANGGISCIINPLGQTIVKTKMFTKNYITGKVGVLNEMTFYTKFHNLIPVFAVFITLIIIALSFLFMLKKILKIKD